jgi:hypothetical protein
MLLKLGEDIRAIGEGMENDSYHLGVRFAHGLWTRR